MTSDLSSDAPLPPAESECWYLGRPLDLRPPQTAAGETDPGSGFCLSCFDLPAPRILLATRRSEAGLTLDGARPGAHGVADQLVFGIKHDEDLVHAQLLGGRSHVGVVIVRAALKDDVLAPLTGPVLDGTVGCGDGEAAVGGGSDDCGNRKRLGLVQARRAAGVSAHGCGGSGRPPGTG